MPRLHALWVNGSVTTLREAWIGEFAGFCELHETEASHLYAREPRTDWDIICFNFDYPEMGCLKLIPEVKARWPSAPVLMITLQCSVELAVWAMRAHVFDLLVKPLTADEITRCRERVLEAVRARRAQSGRRPQMTAGLVPVEVRYRPQTLPSLRLQRAIAHISKHYGRSIPESEVARVCEMSPSRFCREFKATFGMTFVEYLARHRIEEAKRLLGNRDMSVTDVAAAVGFTDPSYFTRVFRRVAGACPTGYREVPFVQEAGPRLALASRSTRAPLLQSAR